MNVLKIILEAYIIWTVVYFLLSYFFKSKRLFKLFLVALFIISIYLLTVWLKLPVASRVMRMVVAVLPIVIVALISVDLRRGFDSAWSTDLLEVAAIGSRETKTHIVEAALALSKNKIGALITIEKHTSLDVYAERAITLDAVVSKELLMNIFTPNTPLHDGAVIIKGDTIRAAGVYFDLSERNKEDKTMGSRHRAALGISETTDSLTIVVSEETGNITLAIDGIMIRANDAEKMYEYINMYLR
ncbi:MAG TPA: TIGR00159 family protein [Acholeplasma sp.]|jgi:diadenylate cyclase|nr:diadenylate cyclase CdaA [Acholeplasmatales bacterium]HHV33263.1 TIGR00159 family protein [Acholeplasma sp.]